MKKQLLLFFLILSASFGLQGQDPHFSQNYATPLYINPGLTGLYNGDVRMTATFRNQWSSISNSAGYRTLAVSVDGKLTPGDGKGSGISGGLHIMSDQAGLLNFSTNAIDVALALNTSLGDAHFLSLGVMAGVNRRSFDFSGAQFGNQFDGVGYSSEIQSNEVFENNSYSRMGLSGGLVYYYMQDNRTYWHAGAAAYNLIQTEKTFIGDGDEGLGIPSRLSAQFGASLRIADRADIVPGVYFIKQGVHYKADIGTLLRYVFMNNSRSGTFRAMSIGPWVRIVKDYIEGINTDALIIATRLDYDAWSFGIAYDFNISVLNTATNGKGGFELTTAYMPKIRVRKLAPTSCPRF